MLNAFVIIIITDPLGVQTATRTWQADGADITETVSAGITNRVTRYFGGAVMEEKYWDGRWTRETRSSDLDTAGCRVETVIAEASDMPGSVVASETTYDFLGRVVCVTTPLGITSNFYSGASDRLVRVSRTGQPDTLYEYETGSAGVPARTVLDVDGDGQVSYSGPDRISATDTRYEEDASNVWWRVTSQSESVGGLTNSAAVVKEQVTGLSPALLSRTVTVSPDGTTTTVTRAFENGTDIVVETSQTGTAAAATRRTRYGQLIESVGLDEGTFFEYDGFVRTVSQTVTNGTGTLSITAVTYDTLGNAVTNTTTYGDMTAVTAAGFDGQGRAVSRTDALSNTVFTAYDSLGQTLSLSGATYPVTYGYDTAGRMTALSTTRDGVELDTTLWLYDHATGLLTNKVYADNSRVSYTYTPNGRLASRVWARGVITSYDYDALTQLTGINYNDSTPDITFAYDRMGNMVSVTDASGTRVFSHDIDGQTITDTLSTIGHDFVRLELRDAFGRETGYSFSNTVNGGTSQIAGISVSYESFGRISQVTVDGVASPFRYESLPGTDLQQSLFMPNGVTRQTIYEPNRDLPASITHTNSSGNILTRRTFTRDAAGNLTGRTQHRSGDTTNRVDAFSQNARGEVTTAELGTNTYAYSFDSIGNRTAAIETNASSVYGANALNQYSVISNFVDSMPSCVFIPEFDADGNQTLIRTSTGVWRVSYNAENRPIVFSNDTGVIEMAYDYQGRRFEYKETVSGATVRHERYLYRGYLQVVALNLLDGTNVMQTVTWDPSEPAATRPLTLQRGTNWWCYGFDQAKNVTELFDAFGVLTAAYDYTPFGGIVSAFGPAVAVNPLTFSSEIDDADLGLIHYTFRPLNRLEGRWFGRDPIGDLSFRARYPQRFQTQNECHTYLFCANSALETIDPDGAMAQPLIDRRHPPKGKRLITVPRNTILIMYGHHFQNSKHPRHGEGFENIWNIVASSDKDKGCAYAAIVTCMAGSVPNEIPLPGYSPVASNAELPIDDLSADSDMGRELGKVRTAADKEAKKMCNRCCAKKIHIEVDSYGLSMGEYLKYPTLTSWNVSCK